MLKNTFSITVRYPKTAKEQEQSLKFQQKLEKVPENL